MDLPKLHKSFFLPAILGVVSISSFLFAIVYLIRSSQEHEPIEFVMGESTSSGTMNSTITVDVAGGVLHPGVYKIAVGSRMEDAINAAGGLSEEASIELLEKAINRAQKVNDGAKIYIPKTNDQTSHNDILRSQSVDNKTSHNIDSSSKSKGIISINSASQSELEGLSGVGPVTASKIIQGRPYISLEELVSKKAVGQKLFESIKDQISL